MLEIDGGNLQSVEDQGGFFGVELIFHQAANHLHHGKLDGVSVLEDGDIVIGALIADAIVEVAEVLGAQGGGAALDAVELDVLAAGNCGFVGHGMVCSFCDWFLDCGKVHPPG